MRLFIIGYMASGKTTFGKALSSRLNAPFIDLDEYIEGKTGKTISEIFAEKGEEGFRQLEKDLLIEATTENENIIMACGGGTPCHFDNMEFLNKNGITVFLETSADVLVERLQSENDKRPLVAGKTDDEIRQKVLTQLCRRLPDYMQAKLKWHGDDLNSLSEIEENVENFVSSYPSIFNF